MPASSTWKSICSARAFHDHGSQRALSFDAKAGADRANPKVREWEELMWKFQQPLPAAKPGEKWLAYGTYFQAGTVAYCSNNGGHLLMKPNAIPRRDWAGRHRRVITDASHCHQDSRGQRTSATPAKLHRRRMPTVLGACSGARSALLHVHPIGVYTACSAATNG